MAQRSVLERGEVANTWRTERWDSLTLLTPNWQSRLPGHGYEGDDPDGFRTMPETIAFLEGIDGVAAVDGPGKARVRFSRLDAGHAAAVIAAAAAHDACASGTPGDWQVPAELADRISSVTPKRGRDPAR